MSTKAWLILGLFAVLAFSGGEAVVQTVITDKTIERLAEAIARAEGYYSDGSRPQRNNNPGDITFDFNFPTTGYDGPFPIFTTAADGWNALKEFLRLIYSGGSQYYRPDMTIEEMNQHYAPGQPEWAVNVAHALGVSVDTPINQIT